MTSITLQLPDEFGQRLREVADREQRPPEEVALDILRRRLTMDRFHELCRGSETLAQAAGYRSEQDVLRDIS